MTGYEIHSYQKNVEQALRRTNEDSLVCPENRALITAFAKERLARGIGRLRVAKCIYCMRYLSHWLKIPFDKAQKPELLSLVGDLENQPYSEHSKHDFKACLKLFYKWLKGNDEIYPPEISWLRARLRNNVHKLPEEMLSEEEVMKMVAAADNARDKALLLVLYETGCRIGEMLSLKIKNVLFDQYGAILRVTGKTGDRRVRIISSAPALTAWLSVHAKAKDPEATLWPPLATSHKYHDHVMEHHSVYTLMQVVAEKAGIRKRVYPHLFRHSRATALAGKLTEAQMKEYFGWTQSSNMASVYVHLSGRDVDKAMLALQGMAKPEEKREEALQLKGCERCKERNSPNATYCIRCGSPLDLRLLKQVEHETNVGNEIMDTLMKNAEFKEFMFKKMVEMGLEQRLTH